MKRKKRSSWGFDLNIFDIFKLKIFREIEDEIGRAESESEDEVEIQEDDYSLVKRERNWSKVQIGKAIIAAVGITSGIITILDWLASRL